MDGCIREWWAGQGLAWQVLHECGMLGGGSILQICIRRCSTMYDVRKLVLGTRWVSKGTCASVASQGTYKCSTPCSLIGSLALPHSHNSLPQLCCGVVHAHAAAALTSHTQSALPCGKSSAVRSMTFRSSSYKLPWSCGPGPPAARPPPGKPPPPPPGKPPPVEQQHESSRLSVARSCTPIALDHMELNRNKIAGQRLQCKSFVQELQM